MGELQRLVKKAFTDFGKTIIFQAYSILTGKITVQLIPLCTLGKAQTGSLNRFEGVNACLMTADTKRNDPELLQKIRRGEYTHILLGGEQSVSCHEGKRQTPSKTSWKRPWHECDKPEP